MDHRSCPACGHRGKGHIITDLLLRAPDGHPLQDGYSVVCCAACGTGFADAVIHDSYYKKYYTSLAKYGSEHLTSADASKPSDPDWISRNASKVAGRIADLLVSKNKRILDIGCSTGSLLAGLHRIGFKNLIGIDPSPESVKVANARGEIRAEVGSFATLPPDIGKFDCVCLTGVLEHLWNVEEAIYSIRSLLNDGGIVYLEVPDAARYLDPYVAPYEDFSTEHINHFSFSSLRLLADRFGMKTIFEFAFETPLTAGVHAAAVSVAWQSGSHVRSDSSQDQNLEFAISAYAKRSAEDFAKIEHELELRLSGLAEYILWGVGETSFKLMALRPLTIRQAITIVDSNASRRQFTFDGVRVLESNCIPSGSVPIVISSLIRADSIENAAHQLGLVNPLIRLDHLTSYN